MYDLTLYVKNIKKHYLELVILWFMQHLF